MAHRTRCIAIHIMPHHALAPLDTETDWLAEADAIRQLAPGHLPTLHDTQRVYRFLKATANGNYIDTAAKIAGFAKQTIYDWKAYAKQGELAAIRLIDAIEKAEAEAEGEMVDCVRSAAKKGPQFWAAGMTYLERRQPDKWGKRTDDTTTPKVVVQIGVQGGDVSVSFGPSPHSSSVQSETSLIQAINTPESDKPDYVNHAKSLITHAIDVPQRSQSERDPGAEMSGGTLPLGVASPGSDGRVRVKGVRGRTRGVGKKKGSR